MELIYCSPDFIENLTNQSVLEEVTTLLDSIGNLTNLTWLYLRYNALEVSRIQSPYQTVTSHFNHLLAHPTLPHLYPIRSSMKTLSFIIGVAVLIASS